MTENDLRKLSRKQLLELLLKQTQRADELAAQLEEAQKKLCDRELSKENAGSMAEAALKLNGVFEAADAAVQLYLENVKKMGRDQLNAAQILEENAKKKADAMIAEAEKRCAHREALAEEHLQRINAQVRSLYSRQRVADPGFDTLTQIPVQTEENNDEAP